MRTLSLVWKAEPVEFKPTFELFMRIEEKVAFNRITDALRKAAQGDMDDLPMSHIAWLLYCCLRHAGVAVRTPMEVHEAIFSGELQYGDTLAGLIDAYYGSQPQKPPKKNTEATTLPSPSPESSTTSKSDSASP